jgi:hypothetical protein
MECRETDQQDDKVLHIPRIHIVSFGEQGLSIVETGRFD